MLYILCTVVRPYSKYVSHGGILDDQIPTGSDKTLKEYVSLLHSYKTGIRSLFSASLVGGSRFQLKIYNVFKWVNIRVSKL
jgi:hypothetical protein